LLGKLPNGGKKRENGRNKKKYEEKTGREKKGWIKYSF